jgi:hypothetical protein
MIADRERETGATKKRRERGIMNGDRGILKWLERNTKMTEK